MDSKEKDLLLEEGIKGILTALMNGTAIVYGTPIGGKMLDPLVALSLAAAFEGLTREVSSKETLDRIVQFAKDYTKKIGDKYPEAAKDMEIIRDTILSKKPPQESVMPTNKSLN